MACCNDVDNAHHRVGAVNGRTGPAHKLDALNVVYRKFQKPGAATLKIDLGANAVDNNKYFRTHGGGTTVP